MRSWILLGVLLPAAALASDLDKAAKRFSSMQYEQGLKLVRRALRSPDNGPRELVAGYRLEGLCLSSLGRSEEALDAFRKLLSIDPSYRLKGDFSPKLTEPFHRAVVLAKEQGPIGLMHQSPQEPESLSGFELRVTLLSDPMKMVSTVRLSYFIAGGKPMRTASRVKGPGELKLPLPRLFKADRVNYYFEAANRYGGVLATAGSRQKPFKLETRAASLATASSKPPVLAVDPASKPRRKREEEKNGGPAFYQTWWFWTVVGVVVAGATTGTVLALSGDDSGGSVDYPVEWGVRP